jgi:hypothetical protein
MRTKRRIAEMRPALQRKRVRLRKIRLTSPNAARDSRAVRDRRAVDRSQAMLGCAVWGIRPPGTW